MASSSVIRTFIAIKVEKPEIVEKVRRLQEDLARYGLKAKFVEPENLHITLKFIGEIPPVKVEALKRKLQQVEYPRFSIEFQGVGGFPSLSRARVLWIGVSKGSEKLIEISEIVEKSLLKAGIPKSSKSFHPHLTIARVKAPLNQRLKKMLEEYRDVVFGHMNVEKFFLMRSVLTSRGPIYSELAGYELK
ncbi:MAG: RNA 2',3'-cyclic phosphodiesterase [Thermoprotei archaeon]|nr:MAG: RNA 2',3'-cyclic phosphodiesterase [Thermoprotei archaeon]